ncbi:autotransporter assembly complex protein TamA [Acinetobacter baumannii]|nr:BamA/TamA family outer membrane protein [Acinetobacter baumannii]EKU7740467.1 BamA/TamA family outer membrane protein [Acinetobacter baumannii]EKV1777712.1 BamA/TamA family outer membrane protein [Acinetobacter baumannii]
MPSKIKFKQSTLSHSMHLILKMQSIPKLICSSLLLSLCVPPCYAQSSAETVTPEANQTVTDSLVQQTNTNNPSDVPITDVATLVTQAQQQQDSLAILQQQEQFPNQIEEFKPITLDNLEDLPVMPVDQNMANEIYRVAEEAKNEAQNFQNGTQKQPEMVVNDASQAELHEINQAPVNIDQLMHEIQSDSKIVVEANETGKTLPELTAAVEEPPEEKGFFRRIFNKIRPPRVIPMEQIPRITAEVTGAPDDLAKNIKGKLSTFTQESFEDFNAALPQLRSLSNQAAQAVGYYNAEFRFEKLSASRVRVNVTPNEPVRINEQNIEFTGAGAKQPQFQVIRLVPDQDVGDIFNHGLYETTKSRIVDAASDNGYFDAYWRLHDVKVSQPENKADINLKYETGERYKLGKVEFRMSDPSKPLPLNMNILESMAPWKEGDDYAFWRVNVLANNLTNSRYFNYTLVDSIKPDPIEKPLELPPDLQALVDQQNVDIDESKLLPLEQQQLAKARQLTSSSKEVTQNVVDEKQFAGTESVQAAPASLKAATVQHEEQESEQDRLQAQAREEKRIPVIVTLNADKLNSLETGIGYGTDTGARLRSQYRRSIVNKYGHSFDANLELSQIRQSIDGRYSIPYKHSLNDYFNIVGGYERETRDDIGPDVSLLTESAVLGGERVIKKPLGNWQHTIGVRYRLDRLTQKGNVDISELPDAFKTAASEQEALLFSYETSKTSSNTRLNPTKAFKQTYKLELGSESLLSDANMAIATAGWRFIYSLGENDDHQFVGRSDFSYIFTDEFDKVPYNLRFFTGGDQTIRGFDYKSLSPEDNGYKIGGQALAVGSLEYNYQFKEGWRAAVFSDFGNAYDKSFSNPTAYSVGVGIRWKSPIGPIRLDVASGISDDNHPIRLHFFIGPQL